MVVNGFGTRGYARSTAPATAAHVVLLVHELAWRRDRGPTGAGAKTRPTNPLAEIDSDLYSHAARRIAEPPPSPHHAATPAGSRPPAPRSAAPATDRHMRGCAGHQRARQVGLLHGGHAVASVHRGEEVVVRFGSAEQSPDGQGCRGERHTSTGMPRRAHAVAPLRGRCAPCRTATSNSGCAA
jgi:hypothetical protein